MSTVNSNSLKEAIAKLKQIKKQGQLVDAAKQTAVAVPVDAAKLTEVNSSHEEVLMRVGELQDALKQESPNFGFVLKDVWDVLKKYPETVHLLTDEQRGILVSACYKYSGVVIATNNRKAGKTADGLRKLKDVTISDI